MALPMSFRTGIGRKLSHELQRTIEIFNNINLFKNLEELHLAFRDVVDLTDPLLLEKLNKVDCKLKKLQIIFWAKHKFLNGSPNESDLKIKEEPRKWLFTLNNFFYSKEIASLSLDHYSEVEYESDLIFEKFEFWEMFVNANLSKLTNLSLSSHDLDLKLIDISKLHKLTIRTDIANDHFAIEIARLYFDNPNLRISWWPRFTRPYDFYSFGFIENIEMFTPDYFQIISCQWPLYFFKSTEISVKKGESLINHSKTPKTLHIILKNEYSIEELFEMDLIQDGYVCNLVLNIINEHEQLQFSPQNKY
ncbi:uncharacterized protein KGF55_004573 [Candida pseudojiufengensis]|uniref:uncharacterized protein n=1 Tax=Candida pseudojiufengensis TaxID=497109 RepID=UPI002223FC00|nr:uncharacterized protein KGF55_004573 [Candida pseudojiufengensis]KAI5960680.1 hypothetical protein KGF55_004573 [Candida pseudojiufengensis]